MLGISLELKWDRIGKTFIDILNFNKTIWFEEVKTFEEEVFNLDKAMCGINREKYLNCWYSTGNYEKLKVYSKENKRLKGFGISIDHFRKRFFIGPIVCDDLKTTGLAIFLKLLQRVKKNYVDQEDSNSEPHERKDIFIYFYKSSGLIEILENFGFKLDKIVFLYLTNEFPKEWEVRFKSIFATCSANYGPF